MVNLRKPQILIESTQGSAEIDADIALSTFCVFTNQFTSASSGETVSTDVRHSCERGEENRVL